MATPSPLAGYPKRAARYANASYNGQAAGAIDSPSFTPPANCLLAVSAWSSEDATLTVTGGGLTWTQAVLDGSYPRVGWWWAKASASPSAMKVTLTASSTATHLGIAVYALDNANTSGLGGSVATTSVGTSPYNVSAPSSPAADSLLLGSLALSNISNLGSFTASAGCVEDFGTGNLDFQGVETASPWPRRWSVGRITSGSSYGGTISGSVPFRLGGASIEVRSGPPVSHPLALSPSHVSPNGGTTVTVTSDGWFGATADLTVDGAVVAATVVNASTVAFVAPLHAPGAVTVSVTSNGITRTATLTYDAVVPPADTDYAEFFLSSLASVVLLETLEIGHPEFSQTYWVVRNKTDGLRALLETGEPQDFDYVPLRIRALGSRENLDFGLSVDLGDLGEIIPQEMDRLDAADSLVRPTVRYRTYRSDDLTKPLYGPVQMEIASISMKREGASFEAKAPSLNLNRTGETYSLDRFVGLRGVL